MIDYIMMASSLRLLNSLKSYHEQEHRNKVKSRKRKIDDQVSGKDISGGGSMMS